MTATIAVFVSLISTASAAEGSWEAYGANQNVRSRQVPTTVAWDDCCGTPHDMMGWLSSNGDGQVYTMLDGRGVIPVPGAISDVAPTLVVWHGLPTVYWVGRDHQIYWAVWESAPSPGGSSPWSRPLGPIPGQSTSQPVGLTLVNGDQLMVAYVGGNRAVYAVVVDSGGNWQSTQVPGSAGVTVDSPAVATFPSGNRVLMAVTQLDGHIAQVVIRVASNNSMDLETSWSVVNSSNYGTSVLASGAPGIAAAGNDLRIGVRARGDGNHWSGMFVYMGGTAVMSSGIQRVNWGSWTDHRQLWNLNSGSGPRVVLFHGAFRALYSDNFVYQTQLL
ncbi:hypothetical protein KUM39_14475 [Streptomyces sp. J2-1]|uniref:hypothetical protein n=1 Tax=Streptomyces corallincola TaxID=2851888 RepID=UPI001C38C751|nr:hypothetical protein [Streptomyces corallincola]MBV2355560.1 hypothetical protein [Streptomyces corallincola]